MGHATPGLSFRWDFFAIRNFPRLTRPNVLYLVSTAQRRRELCILRYDYIVLLRLVQNGKRDVFRYFLTVNSGQVSSVTVSATTPSLQGNTTLVPTSPSPPPRVGLMVGVADGVGAWNTKEKGRPGLWARLLMHYWAMECEERMKLWKVDRATSLSSMSGVR